MLVSAALFTALVASAEVHEASDDAQFNAIGVDIIMDPCVQAADGAGGVQRDNCKGADSAVLSTYSWNDHVASGSEVRFDTTGDRLVGVLSLGGGHEFSRLHVAGGVSLQFLITDRARFAPGPWARVVLFPKRDFASLQKEHEHFAELLNPELLLEATGAWWQGLPEGGVTPTFRMMTSFGSDSLRYGFTTELPLRRPTRAGTLPLPAGPLVGLRVEFRPDPRDS